MPAGREAAAGTAARPRAHWRTGGHTAAHCPAVRGVRERRERAGPRRWAAQQQATARAGRSAVVSQAAGRCLAQTSATCRAPLRQARLRAQQLPAASGASSRAQRACAVGSMVFSRLSHAGAGSRAMQRVISVLQAAPALLCVGDPRPACACWIAHCMRTLLRQCNRDLCRLCEAGSAPGPGPLQIQNAVVHLGRFQTRRCQAGLQNACLRVQPARAGGRGTGRGALRARHHRRARACRRRALDTHGAPGVCSAGATKRAAAAAARHGTHCLT